MSNVQILAFGEPSLHKQSVEVDLKDPALASEIKTLSDALARFQSEYGWGRAMAAPQIGINKRLIAIKTSETTQILINPQIISKSAETMIVWDDCMSMPTIAVEVERHRSIDVSYLDENGKKCTLTQVSPELSELLQHEIDHLDGIVMTDRLISGGAVIHRDLINAYKQYRSAAQIG